MQKLTITIETPDDEDMTEMQEEFLSYLCMGVLQFSEDSDPFDAENPPTCTVHGMRATARVEDCPE